MGMRRPESRIAGDRAYSAPVGTGKTVRIAVMPAGQDPDDILKAEGAEVASVFYRWLRILDSLWQTKFTAYKLDDTRTQPGARAAFWADMRQLVRSISHNQTRTAYLDDVEFRIGAMRAASKGTSFGGGAIRLGRWFAQGGQNRRSGTISGVISLAGQVSRTVFRFCRRAGDDGISAIVSFGCKTPN